MPDWTYLPTRPVAVRVLGERRADRAAAAGVGLLARTYAGRALMGALAGTRTRPAAVRVVAGVRCPSPVAVRVGVGAAAWALRVLPALGAGLVEIGPVGPGDGPRVHEVLSRRPTSVPVALRFAEEVPEGVRRSLAAEADLVTDEDLGVVTAHRCGVGRAQAPLVRFEDLRHAVDQVHAGAALVLVGAADLLAEGPGLLNRLTEAVVGREHPEPNGLRSCGGDPRRWPGWLWAALLGIGLVCGGLGAAVIALGPVLLWYDLEYLGAGVDQLDAIDPQVLDFILHDRISMGGAMVALGVLYLGLANGMRLGWEWAREALFVSGVVGFPTLAFFLAHGFVDPLHVGLTVVLLPLFVLAVRAPSRPRWRV